MQSTLMVIKVTIRSDWKNKEPQNKTTKGFWKGISNIWLILVIKSQNHFNTLAWICLHIQVKTSKSNILLSAYQPVLNCKFLLIQYKELFHTIRRELILFSIQRGQNVVFAQQEQPPQVHARCYGAHCAAGAQMAPGCLIFVCNRESDSKPKNEYIVDERYQEKKQEQSYSPHVRKMPIKCVEINASLYFWLPIYAQFFFEYNKWQK